EEIFVIMTWLQLGVHKKTIGVLHVGRYFDPLLAMLDHAVGEGFLQASYREMWLVGDDPDALLELMCTWVAPPLPQWIRGTQT
ncbi:MAG: LOG family protein, partial [Myxococcota bacterium]